MDSTAFIQLQLLPGLGKWQERALIGEEKKLPDGGKKKKGNGNPIKGAYEVKWGP